MQTYNYIAKDRSTGGEVKSTIQAQNENDAAKLIRESGLVPITIKIEKKANSEGISGLLNRISSKDKILFARQLSTLINAGLPLSQSLRSVADQTPNKAFRVIINNIVIDIEGGKTLSSALSKCPKVFNKIFVSLVEAGESSGTLDVELDRVATQQEKDADIVSKVRGALIYPAIVMFVMVAVVVFMIVKVIPQIQELYTSFPGANLPFITKALISLSKLIINWWWLLVLIIAGLIVFVIRWLRTDSGVRFFDKLKLTMPPFKNLFHLIYMARFSRTSSSLIGAGVPLLTVLQITGDTVSNYYVSESIKKAAEKVKGGKSLGDALTGDPYFLPLVPSMLKIGEKSGSVEAMMSKAAEYYEKEVDNIIKNISSLVEPIMMVILGVVAIMIVVAILLPIYGLAGSGAISGNGG